MSLASGTRIGPYEVVGMLGAGGMGDVYRAHDSRLDREVAIKVLPGDFSRDDDRLRRFEQEAKATSALNHPNILTVYDIGEHEGAPFIVAELLEGEELRRRLDEGPIPLRKATDYARQIVATSGRSLTPRVVTDASPKPTGRRASRGKSMRSLIESSRFTDIA